MSIEHFLNRSTAGWMNGEGEASDIVLSTRIRLARNVANYRFPTIFSKEEALEVKGKLIHAVEGDAFEVVEMGALSVLDRRVLVEKHLISPQLADREEVGAILLSEDEKLSVLVNEEDHVRIQSIYPGLHLEEAYERAMMIDDTIEKDIPYAYDKEFGYLTSCPSNTGTGLRASVMMHLPALTMTKQMQRVVVAVSRLGMTVRGSYGEGSEAPGNIYQLSNQLTLGKSEVDIIEELKQVVLRLIAHERESRKWLLQRSPIALEDKLYRSLGRLTHARLLASGEAAKALSDVRLGIDLGLIEDVDMSVLNELMIFMQPAFLQRYANETLDANERDQFRAKLFRERLAFSKP